MYILVRLIQGNYGGEYEDVEKLDTLGDLMDRWAEVPEESLRGMYEVAREITSQELRTEHIRIAREAQNRREAAMDEARKHLTRGQLRDLGLI